MPDTAERTKCRCGLSMMTTAGGGKYCTNCDETQPQEAWGMERRKTQQDVRFEMYWLRTEEREYTDNRKNKPEVGTPNPDEPEETPNE